MRLQNKLCGVIDEFPALIGIPELDQGRARGILDEYSMLGGALESLDCNLIQFLTKNEITSIIRGQSNFLLFSDTTRIMMQLGAPVQMVRAGHQCFKS